MVVMMMIITISGICNVTATDDDGDEELKNRDVIHYETPQQSSLSLSKFYV